jgi:hypothetical protein
MDLERFSNFNIVKNKGKKLLGINIEKSSRKDKKYMIRNPDNNKLVHFGQMGYEDFTKHKDKKRRIAFQTRNKRFATAYKYTPAYLSYYLLW